ncbi:MAG: hypothetical protein C4518_01540 [Desulfobacteraceae bacterium]|nr:MAG: hypothetical protein C4518_01540 [Desulfobacteraceae bacterium]
MVFVDHGGKLIVLELPPLTVIVKQISILMIQINAFMHDRPQIPSDFKIGFQTFFYPNCFFLRQKVFSKRIYCNKDIKSG